MPDMSCSVSIYSSVLGSRSNSGDLLISAAKSWCRETGTPIPDMHVERPQFKKPYFRSAPWICFSVTHSGDYWLCAFSQQNVGLDLQREQKAQTTRIASRFFHPDETAYLQLHPHSFFDIWAAKESYVKFTGTGIDDNFSSFSVVNGGRICSASEGFTIRLLPFVPGYSLALCSVSACSVSVHQLERE